MMRVYILTYGRVDRQITLGEIPVQARDRVTIVCHESELAALQETIGDSVSYLPHSIVGSSATREFIFEHHWENEDDPRFLMLDDDLRFSFRGPDKLVAFNYFEEDERAELFEQMFSEVEEAMAHYAISGVLTRGFANHRQPTRWYLNYRVNAVWGGNARILKEHDIKFNRVTYADDYDILMQVLESGLDFVSMNFFLQDAVPPAMKTSPGGEWSLDRLRNVERKIEQYQKLSDLHPGKLSFWVKKGVDPDELQPQHVKLRVNWSRFGRPTGPIGDLAQLL